MWSGFMQMVHNSNDHPAKSEVIFMPMIDMQSSDPSCILSTMQFVSNQAHQYDHTPILTFDQPLYWKAMEIQIWENQFSDFKAIVLILGQYHTRMSFLGSIGYLMTGSGFDSILKLVYAENVVPHVMSGKAIARAIRGYILVAAALHAIMVSRMFNSSIFENN